MKLYELEIGSWFYNEYGELCILRKKTENGICTYYSSDEGTGIETRQDAIGFPLTERNRYISDWVLWLRKRLSDEGLLDQETNKDLNECLISLMEIEDNIEKPRNWAFQEPYKSIRTKLFSKMCYETILIRSEISPFLFTASKVYCSLIYRITLKIE